MLAKKPKRKAVEALRMAPDSRTMRTMGSRVLPTRSAPDLTWEDHIRQARSKLADAWIVIDMAQVAMSQRVSVPLVRAAVL